MKNLFTNRCNGCCDLLVNLFVFVKRTTDKLSLILSTLQNNILSDNPFLIKLSTLVTFLVCLQKKTTVGFKCPTGAACRHVWRCAIEQMLFFTWVLHTLNIKQSVSFLNVTVKRSGSAENGLIVKSPGCSVMTLQYS